MEEDVGTGAGAGAGAGAESDAVERTGVRPASGTACPAGGGSERALLAAAPRVADGESLARLASSRGESGARVVLIREDWARGAGRIRLEAGRCNRVCGELKKVNRRLNEENQLEEYDEAPKLTHFML